MKSQMAVERAERALIRENSIAAQIAHEFGRLFRDGRGSIEKICDKEAGQVSAFLDHARAPIIKGLLPSIWECRGGGYGAFLLGPDGSEALYFSDDLSRWRVRDQGAFVTRAGVPSLMFHLGCGRLVVTHDLTLLLGVATARVLLGETCPGAPKNAGRRA
jgi:hypothetical protein